MVFRFKTFGSRAFRAAEREQLARQRRGALSGPAHFVDDLLFGSRQVVPLAEDVAVADHDHQQIVEVVCHAAGELPDGLHLLGLPELLLKPGGFAHVSRDREVLHPPVSAFHGRRPSLDGAARAVRPGQVEADTPPVAATDCAMKRFEARAVLGCNQPLEFRADERRCARRSVHRESACVDLEDRAVRRQQRDRFGARVHDRLQLPLAQAQILLQGPGFDHRPAALGRRLQQRDLVRTPVARRRLVHGEDRAQLAGADERAADQRVDLERVEHVGAVAERRVCAYVPHHESPAFP